MISKLYWLKNWQVFENAGDARSQSLETAVISNKGGTYPHFIIQP